MKSLYESIIYTDTEIISKGKREIFLSNIVYELKRNFDFDFTSYSENTGKSILPFAMLRNFKDYQYKKALDGFEDRLGIIKDTLKRKEIKTNIEVNTRDSATGRFLRVIKDYKITFVNRNLKVVLYFSLMFSGEYKSSKDTILKLEYINISSENAEIKEMLK